MKKWKVYQTELINGSKGTIHISEEKELRSILEENEFIKDASKDLYIRSDAVVKFEFVGYTDE